MNASTSITRLHQKLRREELKLARLKSRFNQDRARDTRLKYRLGSLIFILGWQNWDRQTLESKLESVSSRLSNVETRNELQAIGSAELDRRANQKIVISTLSTAGLSEQQRLNLDHLVITIGGLMVKHGLDAFPQGSVLGALLDGKSS